MVFNIFITVVGLMLMSTIVQMWKSEEITDVQLEDMLTYIMFIWVWLYAFGLFAWI